MLLWPGYTFSVLYPFIPFFCFMNWVSEKFWIDFHKFTLDNLFDMEIFSASCVYVLTFSIVLSAAAS